MKTLHITIRDKIATYMKRDGEIVCGNSDYQIEFDFDNEWDAYADKTARFIWNGQHFDQPFSGNICRVPVIKNTTSCLVGVYVEDLETTTPAQIDCLKSVLCNNTTRYSESDVIYADEAQEAAKRAEDAAGRAEDSLERAEEIVDSLEDGSYIESDPTVPSWAKQPTKPKYTAEEVGARPNTWTPTADDLGAPVKGTKAPNSTALSIKPVPADAAPYAEVVEVGGLTRKCTQVWDEQWQLGYYDDTTGIFTAYSNFFASKNKIRVLPNTAYSVTCPTNRKIVFYDVNQNFLSGIGYNVEPVITTPSDCYYMAFSLWSSYGVEYKNDIMINEGSTALPYEPYFEGLRSAKVESVESVGVNIWDEQWEKGYINLENGDLLYNTETIRSKNFITVKPSITYYMYNGSWNEYRIAFYDNSKNIISDTAYNPFTTPSNCYYIKFYSSGTEYKNDICINEYDVAINGKYYPSIRNTLPIPEAVRNLDGYGWGIDEQVYNYIDLEKKQFVKRVGCVDLGALNWGYGNYFGTDTKCFYSTDISGAKLHNAYVAPTAICHLYNPTTANEIAQRGTQGYALFADAGVLTICDNNYTDAASFKAAMSGVMLVYELATPIITDISDLLPADNLIGVESGGTVRMVNEYGYDVPNNITFYEGKNEVVGADTFVGNLRGTAARALADGEGKQLATREWVLEQLAALMSGGE